MQPILGISSMENGMENTEPSLKREVFIPIKIVKRGSAKTQVIASNDRRSKLNHPLARALIKAYKWEKEMLEFGGIDLYCRRNKLSKRYVQRIIKLNFLNPRIKKAIMDGDFPQNILLQDLVYKQIDILWHKQDSMIVRLEANQIKSGHNNFQHSGIDL